MGVSLETGQCKFASIIKELSQVPTTLSQFFVWVDVCVAEYKTRGYVSLSCSGRKPDPDWLYGLKEILEAKSTGQLQPSTSWQFNPSGNIYKDKKRDLVTICDAIYDQGQTTVPSESYFGGKEQSPVTTVQKHTTKTTQYIYVHPKTPPDLNFENNKQQLLPINPSHERTNQIAKMGTEKENSVVVRTDINGNTNSVNSKEVISMPGKNKKEGSDLQTTLNLGQKESERSVVPVSLFISSKRPVISSDQTTKTSPNSSPKATNKCLQNPAANSRTKRKSVLISNFLETAKLQNKIKSEAVSDTDQDSGSGAADMSGNCSSPEDLSLVITDIRTEPIPYITTQSQFRHNNDDTQDWLLVDIKSHVKTEQGTVGCKGKRQRVRGQDYVPGPVKKARTNVGNMQFWLRDVYGEERLIEEMSPQELDKYLSEFLMDVRKRNGEDYDPNSFKDIRGSFERHLQDRGYPYSIIKSGLFAKTQKAYLKKRDILRSVLHYKTMNNDAQFYKLE